MAGGWGLELNVFLSGGAVTSIQDRRTMPADVKKADSRVLDAASYQTAREKTCPLYPFCGD